MPVLKWEHRCHEIPRSGIVRDIHLDADARAALGVDLNVLGFDTVHVSYTLTPRRAGRFQLAGRVQADTRLECGVSLDPVVQRIDETFDIEFWPPADMMNQTDDVGFDPLAETDVETIQDGRIDAGRAVQEIIASAIDPFARDATAALEVSEAAPAVDPKAHPFAALAALKTRTDGADS